MNNINILSPHVADLIAAGEVVERPASVVKELMENSVDAGAKNIRVEIKKGGMELIRVTDDGSGMSAEDAGVAFLRHATSKLRDERGLEAIATLGFRGEALAAISAVSHIELLTRRRGSDEGTRVTLSAGDIQEMGPAGCPEGSSMSVRDLFYNTPARLKFMKSDRAETSACAAAALRCALAHTEVSIRFIRDGQEEFFTPGDGQARSAVYSLLGRDNAMNMLECSYSGEGVSVTGFTSAPHACRGNRTMQYFFINGRPFRSLTIQAALEQAYKNTMLVGRFPACVLYIQLAHSRVDVNVHPTKSEVKFSEEKKVFDAVYFAVLSALGAKDSAPTAEIKLSPSTVKAAKPRADFFRNMSAEEFRRSQTRIDLPRPQAPREKISIPVPERNRADIPAPPRPAIGTLRTPQPEPLPSPLVPRPEIPVIKPDGSTGILGRTPEPKPETKPEPKPAEAPAVPDHRIIGETLDTYILVETEGSLLLIDKHAAHERMIFDRLHREDSAMSQSLLLPVTWSPGGETLDILEQHGELLERFGFDIEPYGMGSVIIRAVPADTDGSEISMLEEIVSALQKGKAEDPRDSVYHTIACKAAIKAGWKTDPRELAVLVEAVLSGQVRYCPHGRPVSTRLTRAELDKFFKRIV